MVCREEMIGGDYGFWQRQFCDAVREVEKGKCVCLCAFIGWYTIRQAGKIEGKLV